MTLCVGFCSLLVWLYLMQECELNMHLNDGSAEKSTALWEALAMLSQLRTLTVEDSVFNDISRGFDCNFEQGLFLPSVFLMSQVRWVCTYEPMCHMHANL